MDDWVPLGHTYSASNGNSDWLVVKGGYQLRKVHNPLEKSKQIYHMCGIGGIDSRINNRISH